MAVEHNTLTGANLHEPKGVAAATANKVYLSDGAASGAWSKVTVASLDTPVTDSITAAGVAGGGWRKIGATQTAATSATIDFATGGTYTAAFDGTYDELMVVLSNVKPATDNVGLWLRFGTGAGPTYQSSVYAYAAHGRAASNVALNNAAAGTAAQILLTSSQTMGTTAGETLNGRIYFGELDASEKPMCDYTLRYFSSTGDSVIFSGIGTWTTTSAVTGIRFMTSSGNIASGKFALYGLYKG